METLDQGIYIEHRQRCVRWEMRREHAHRFHELYFLLSGRRRYLIGYRICDVEPGDVVLIPREVLHRTTSLDGGGYTRYVVYFFEEYIQDFVKLVGREPFDALLQGGCLQLPPEQVQRLQSLLEEMEAKQEKNEPYSQAAIKTLFQQVLLLLLCHSIPTDRPVDGSVSRIETVTRYINEHYAAELTLEQAARMAYMEKTYFSKCFKRDTGFGFSEYLVQTRLRAGEFLLKYSELSIGEIADRCGFSGSNYFGDCFKRATGMSPSQYRKREGMASLEGEGIMNSE